MRQNQIIKILLLIVSVLFFQSCNNQGSTGLAPGDYVPSIDLIDLKGNIKKISDYKGKVLLLNFWASWCGPCLQEMPALQDLYNRLDKNKFEILAVGVDDNIDSLAEFAKKYSLTFPILLDKDGKANSKFKLTGVPETFFLDGKGQLLMFPDITDNMPVVRIVGPREWNSKESILRISEFLN